MKKMSKGKKIAIIIISVILSLAIILPTGIYAFVIFILPRNMDGEAIKAEYIDNPAMSISCQEYDKQNLTLSGKTTTYTEKSFEITLPENFVFNEEASKDGFYSYWIKDGEKASASIIISEPIFTDENKNDPEHEEEWKMLEAIQIEYKLLCGHASKKAYGIKLGTQYDQMLLVNTMDIDDFDTENHNQVFLFSLMGMQKSMSVIGTLTRNGRIYKLETDTYKGFIYDRSDMTKTEEDGTYTSYNMYSVEAYALDNLNYPYNILIHNYDDVLTEEDVFAILNSFKVK